MLLNSASTGQFIADPTSFLRRPPSPPILGFPDTRYAQNTLPPQVIYKPSNQELQYKQKVIIRWLKPPTPPPSAPIIIRGIF
jgi:hypothetical protein